MLKSYKNTRHASSIEKAVGVLMTCKRTAPAFGFIHPYIAPGGLYGDCWWSLDAALAVDGLLWIEPQMGRYLLENLMAVQKPDGRIPLYGKDTFSHISSVQEPIGSLPKFFESCFRVVNIDSDLTQAHHAYMLFSRNLEWWFTRRQDPHTRLITAVFEETFIPNTVSGSGVYAPMDTNMEVAAGCRYTARLADKLGKKQEAAYYRAKESDILHAVSQQL